MSGTSLDYHIEDKKKIVVCEGTLDSINQKNSNGFFVENIVDKFDMTLKLKQPAHIKMIEISTHNAPKVIFELFDSQGKVHESTIRDFAPNGILLVEFNKGLTYKLATSKVRITICNVLGKSDPIMVGLKYVLIRGEKIDPSKASKRDITKKPEFTDAHHSPHNIAMKTKDTGALFADRKKNKEKEKPQIDDDSINFRKAIEMSKKQARQREDIAAKSKNQKGAIYMQEKEERARNYDLVDFDKVKHIYSQVNSSWLQAQRKIEIERGVKEHQRLSKYIRECFNPK